MKTIFSYLALIMGAIFLFYFDLCSLTSNCWASASLFGEVVVHDVEVM